MHASATERGIFDAWAEWVLPLTGRGGTIPGQFNDPKYIDFLLRFAHLYKRALALLPVAIRGLDVYLLWASNDNP